MFNLAIIGDNVSTKQACQIIEHNFNNIAPYPINVESDSTLFDKLEQIKSACSKCDGILYTRIHFYMFYGKSMSSNIPTRYVEIEDAQILIALFHAIQEIKTDLRGISIDLNQTKNIIDRFQFSGIDISHVNICPIDTSSVYLDANEILIHHLNNHANGANFCLTSFPFVYNALQKQKIPSYLVSPSRTSYIREIRSIQFKKHCANVEVKRCAMLYICLRYKENLRFLPKLQEFDELSHFYHLMHLYAVNLDGASFSQSRWEHIIMCDEADFRKLSENFKKIEIMDSIDAKTPFSVFIAVGFGATIKQAYNNSMTSYAHGVHFLNSSTVITDVNGITQPTIVAKKRKFSAASDMDEKIQEVAKKSGVGDAYIYKLYLAVHQRNSKVFTSKEISEVLNITSRSSNRLLEKLLDSGYAIYAGKQNSASRGRPQRYIRLMF